MKIQWNLWIPLFALVFCSVFFFKKKHDADKELPPPDFQPNLNLPAPNYRHLFRGHPLLLAEKSPLKSLLGIPTGLQSNQEKMDLFLGINNHKLIAPVSKLPLTKRIPVGLSLTYSILWNGLEVAEAWLETVEDSKSSERIKILCRVRTNTNPVIEMIYPVNNLLESTVEHRSGRTLKYFKDQNEGRHQRQDLLEVNSTENLVRYRKYKLNQLRRDLTYRAPENAVDPLAALFHLRTIDQTQINQTFTYNILKHKKFIEIKLTQQRDREVQVPLGKFTCSTIEPNLSSEEFFDDPSSGKALIYLEKNTGVIIKIDVQLYPPIGNVSLELKKWTYEQSP